MEIRIEVPFVANDGAGGQCLQAALAGAVKKFLGRDMPLDDLDRLCGRPANGETWTPQLVVAAVDLGLDVRFHSMVALKPQLAGEAFVRAQYGAVADSLIANTNVAGLQAAVARLLEAPLAEVFSERATTVNDLASALTAGFVPMAMIDAAKLYRLGGRYKGHFVTVTGLTDDAVIYHESGPARLAANRTAPRRDFEAAMHAPGTDNDVVIVRGRFLAGGKASNGRILP